MKSINLESKISNVHDNSDPLAMWLDRDVESILKAVGLDRIQSLKELLRHGIYSLGLYRYLDVLRQIRGSKVKTNVNTTVENRFGEIYDRGLWVKEQGQESLSGTGSSQAATAGLFTALTQGMSELGCQTLLDVGCGDWNWLKHETFSIDYTGIDVVESVINRNKQYFAGPNVNFRVCNAIRQRTSSGCGYGAMQRSAVSLVIY
jgi:hypothetical protein